MLHGRTGAADGMLSRLFFLVMLVSLACEQAAATSLDIADEELHWQVTRKPLLTALYKDATNKEKFRTGLRRYVGQCNDPPSEDERKRIHADTLEGRPQNAEARIYAFFAKDILHRREDPHWPMKVINEQKKKQLRLKNEQEAQRMVTRPHPCFPLRTPRPGTRPAATPAGKAAPRVLRLPHAGVVWARTNLCSC